MNTKFVNSVFIILCFYLASVPTTKGSAPGTFFWRPRLGLFLTMPRKQDEPLASAPVHRASRDNIYNGSVLLTNRYKMALSILALTEGVQSYTSSKNLVYLQPTTPYFYTNAWRWFLRHFDMLMEVIAHGKPYVMSQKTWNNRFTHLNSRIPKSLRFIMLPFITSKDWAREEKYQKMYRQYAEPVFSRYYRYPEKRFQNYASEMRAQQG